MRTFSKKKIAISLFAATTLLLCVGFMFEHICFKNIAGEALLTDLPEAREIPNFFVVHSYLFRGAHPTPHGMQWLKEHGVRTIVDLRESESRPVIGERITAEQMGFNYINLPVTYLPTREQVNLFITTVEAARKDNNPVFVHCSYGSDRTGLFVFAWRVIGDKWRWSLSLCEMIERGFFIHKFSENKTKALSDPKNW